MEISHDLIVFLKIGNFTLNATIVFMWIVMEVLGMLIGLVQAYIFAVLATRIYSFGGTRTRGEGDSRIETGWGLRLV